MIISYGLLHWRILGFSPVLFRVFHEDADEFGDEIVEDADGGAELFPVDLAVPGGPAVHELIAEGIEAVEEDGEEDGGFLFRQRLVGDAFVDGKESLPLTLRKPSLLEAPERTEDVTVVHKNADTVGVVFPGEPVDAVFRVQLTDPAEKAMEQAPLRGGFVQIQIPGIGGVEGDPKQKEGGVGVFAFLRRVQPAQCPVNAQPDPRGRVVPDLPMPFFQCFKA